MKNARAGSLAVKGAQLFNLLPESLRNSEHGDILMFKNHLDIFLENIPDEPTIRSPYITYLFINFCFVSGINADLAFHGHENWTDLTRASKLK